MRLLAHQRLLLGEAEDVSYEQYAAVVQTLAHDPHMLQAFDFKVPGALKKLWSELKEVGELLKESANIGWASIVEAFQQKSVFALLKGVGFSLKKLLSAVIKAAAIPAATLFQAIDDLVDTFGDSTALKALNISERVAKLDAIIHRHPVLTKLTGVAVAGFLIWQFIHMSNTGDVHYDLALVDTIVSCVHGNFDLAEMFASKQGLKDISVLIFGLATGGMGITGYGASHVEKALHILGQHAGDVSSLLLALFYSAAKKLKLKIDYSSEPVVAALQLALSDPAGRTQRWYNQLSEEQRSRYRRKFPGTKFHDKSSKLVLPKG